MFDVSWLLLITCLFPSLDEQRKLEGVVLQLSSKKIAKMVQEDSLEDIGKLLDLADELVLCQNKLQGHFSRV